MRRREFITLLGGAATWPLAARAQTASKTYRLASLTLLGPLPGVYGPTLMRALGERGYIQGQNLELQPFGAAGMPLSRLPEFAQDVAANKFDAAVVAGYPPAAAMKGTGVPTVVGSGAGRNWSGHESGSARRQYHRYLGRRGDVDHQANGAAEGSKVEPSSGRDALE